LRTQIYTMQSVEEAISVADLGVDHVGITPSNIGLPGEIDYETAGSIVKAIGNSAVTVALSVSSDLDEIDMMVRRVCPDILHLCGYTDSVSPADVQFLRQRLSDIPIMQAISVVGVNAIDKAVTYEPVVDYFILDTQSKDIVGIGASGETHDWNISREIVKRVNKPVILAGGLSPENVADAIRFVQPWGVDSLTRTNSTISGGGFCKDLKAIQRFVAASKGAC